MYSLSEEHDSSNATPFYTLFTESGKHVNSRWLILFKEDSPTTVLYLPVPQPAFSLQPQQAAGKQILALILQ